MILSSIIFQGLIFAKIAQEFRCKDPKSIQKNRIYMAGEMLWDFVRFLVYMKIIHRQRRTML